MLYNPFGGGAMYTVKQAAGILGISVHTVRYYDDKGLIPGTKRNSANQRMFDDDELEWLFVRVYLKTPQRCSILPKSPICCVAFACIPPRSAALMRLASGAFWRIYPAQDRAVFGGDQALYYALSTGRRYACRTLSNHAGTAGADPAGNGGDETPFGCSG